MNVKLMGRKRGMTQAFDKDGNLITCTVISAEPNVVTQVKTVEKDGYQAVQLGFEKVNEAKKRNLGKAKLGKFNKTNVEPRRHLFENRLTEPFQGEVGTELGLETFEGVEYVDVQGTSKGKGFQGVIKRHGFAGGPAAHGSGFHRHGGSCGMRSSPGRCLPGQKKAGRMGGETVTIQSLKIIRVIPEKNAILVKGAVPGPVNGLVYISKAIKRAGR